jgi:hypothetical protein
MLKILISAQNNLSEDYLASALEYFAQTRRNYRLPLVSTLL